MNKIINIKTPKNLITSEFVKSIPFISEDIIDYQIVEGVLILKIKDGADEDAICINTQNIMKKFVGGIEINRKILAANEKKIKYHNDIVDNKNIELLIEGSITLHEKAAMLFDFFDEVFKNMAVKIGGKVEHYPTMLPVEDFKKTGYLKTSPQYSIFCCNSIEDFSKLERLHYANSYELKALISEPREALSPAACFHTYCSHKNQILKEPTVYTFNQAVFRNEGRFNWQEFGRLKDYHVREVVFFGDEVFVNSKRNKLLELVVDFMDELNLCFCVTTANDPFVMPNMQKYKKIQLQECSKYEVLLKYDSDKSIAVASFNIHGTAFTNPFNISVVDVDTPVTGCVGFGIERWVLAFVAQYGWNDEKWPLIIKRFINKEC